MSFTQLINKDHLKGVTTTSTSRTGWNPNTTGAGNVYIIGSTRTRILENNVSTFTESKNIPLGVQVKDKKFIKFYVDGSLVTTSAISDVFGVDRLNTSSISSHKVPILVHTVRITTPYYPRCIKSI